MRERIVGSAFRNLGNLGKLYYHAVGGKWEGKLNYELELCYGKTCNSKKDDTT